MLFKYILQHHQRFLSHSIPHSQSLIECDLSHLVQPPLDSLAVQHDAGEEPEELWTMVVLAQMASTGPSLFRLYATCRGSSILAVRLGDRLYWRCRPSPLPPSPSRDKGPADTLQIALRLTRSRENPAAPAPCYSGGLNMNVGRPATALAITE